MRTPVGSICDVVVNAVPAGATVLVVSKGDDRLLELGGRRGWHFPRDVSGHYAGYHPKDSRAAIEHLEELRAQGGQFLLLPDTAFWWLDHYTEFRTHLDQHYRRVVADERCVVYRLNDGPAEDQPAAAAVAGNQVITLDYPVNAVPRYGYGRPTHRRLYDLFDAHRASYRPILTGFLEYERWFREVPVQADPARPAEPSWVNGYFPGLDAISLYGLLARGRPRLYMEIGSGNSTKFAAKAIRGQGLPTTITSIDPCPRAKVGALCDRAVRQPLEDVDLAEFGRLGSGDVLFFDGSHRCFMNSDVTVFFLDVLPELRPGVLVGIHDIYLPDDYPPPFYPPLYYSEQYLLATHLLAGGDRTEVVLPNRFVYMDPDLSAVLAPLYERLPLSKDEQNGCMFWFRTR